MRICPVATLVRSGPGLGTSAEASETCHWRLLRVLLQPASLFWLPWEPLQHLANCETALPLYWGCHSENAEFNGSVEQLEFREWLVP